MLANSVDCYITVNGTKLPEYDAYGLFITHKECFIPITEGKRFSINVDMKQYPAAKYAVAAWANGTTVANEYFISDERRGSTIMEIDSASIIMDEGNEEGPIIYKDMVFELPKIDTDASAITAASKRTLSADEKRMLSGSTIGTIIVQVGIELPMKNGFIETFLEWPVLPRVGLDGAPIPQPPGILKPCGPLGREPEDKNSQQVPQQKAQGQGQSAEVVKNAAPPVFTGWETCIGPVIATFRFKFGTKEALLAMNLIPEDGDVDGMSMKELQQEVKKLRAEKRKRVDESAVPNEVQKMKKLRIEKE